MRVIITLIFYAQGTSDPYCSLLFGKKKLSKTEVIENSLDPEWKAKISPIAYINRF
jgi:Ca2+-dependent lipid-binding protein